MHGAARLELHLTKPLMLVTGATGFVGKALLKRLQHDAQFRIRAAVRSEQSVLGAGVERVVVGDLTPDIDWTTALHDVDVVVHLAARVHMMRDTTTDPLAEYRRVNRDATLSLGRQAAQAGVRRFVFVSSIKVNGESTTAGAPYRADDLPAPVDAYGISKREAEDGLLQLVDKTRLEVVVVRPPLVYGPGVAANFLKLMQLVKLRLPLPFGRIGNRRSLVALDNLVDLLLLCSAHPAASNQIFMVSDGNDLSITDLIRLIAKSMGRPSILLPVPEKLMLWGARAIGKPDVANRLLGSLQVDISAAQKILGWQPIVSPEAAVRETVRHFLAVNKKA